MGQSLQKKHYVIVFDGSPQEVEDTLRFFDAEIRENNLPEAPLHGILHGAHAVHAGNLNLRCVYRDYYAIRDGRMVRTYTRDGCIPAMAHLLNLNRPHEIENHLFLSKRFRSAGLPVANPYNEGTENCDSKFRMFRVLADSGINVPETMMISRFNMQKEEALAVIGRSFHPAGFYVQPDRGTEGINCYFMENTADNQNLERLRDMDVDLVARKESGNSFYRGKRVVFRINVCYDGNRCFAESGYCMACENPVVSAGNGANRVSINKVLRNMGTGDAILGLMRETSCNAVTALFAGEQPTLLIGVDVVLENLGQYRPSVIDVNPRPVVVGSRVFGSDWIGLGRNYWLSIKRTLREPEDERKTDTL